MIEKMFYAISLKHQETPGTQNYCRVFFGKVIFLVVKLSIMDNFT